jgi:RNA polymerase sigma-70 factor (ECF subfamily)
VTGHREDARDAVQQAFVQAFVKLETFRRGSAFYTWLYRIAINTSIDHRRRRRPTASVDRAREDHGLEPADPNPGPAGEYDRAQRCREVRRAIAALDEDHRRVVVLREIDGCTYDQIADILDVPVGTVRSRLHRARVELKELLKTEGNVTPG